MRLALFYGWRLLAFNPVVEVQRRAGEVLLTLAFLELREETHLALLPAAARRRLLDAALGPGRDEGTLQPTARIRGDMEQAWLNAALRPWALTDPPYNTRAEVQAGLADWAVNPARRRLAADLRAQAPRARRALARYYSRHFGLPSDQATRFAAFAVDHLFRSSFVFARARVSEPAPVSNPWPSRP